MKRVLKRTTALLLAVVVFFNTIIYSSVEVKAAEVISWELAKKLVTWVGKTVAAYFLGKGIDAIWDKFTSKTEVKIDENGEITLTEEQVLLLASIIEEYATEHPEDVEKLDYNLFRTSTYEEMWKLEDFRHQVTFEDIDYSPESLNTLDNFRKIWATQSEFKNFPSLLQPHVYTQPWNSVKTPFGGHMNQYLTMFRGYEASLSDTNKTAVFVGSYNPDGTYHISIYIYDYTEKTLTLDRFQSMLQQYRVFPIDGNGNEIKNDGNVDLNSIAGYKAISILKYNNSSWGDAIIACDYSYRGILNQLPYDFNTGETTAYVESLKAIQSQDYFTTTLPLLATPDGRSFKLFPTQEDALAYMRTEKKPGSGNLNYDPSLGYTGGSITINNNGDVTINNNPPDVGEDDPIGSSEIHEMIFNRLGEILTQVAQIKQFSVADTIINAFDAYEGNISQITDELTTSLSQVFPFCILWDFVRIVKIFEAEPVSPVFKIPIKFVWIDETITIDLTEYETLFALLRTGEIILFLFGLFNITMSWVAKGDDVV